MATSATSAMSSNVDDDHDTNDHVMAGTEGDTTGDNDSTEFDNAIHELLQFGRISTTTSQSDDQQHQTVVESFRSLMGRLVTLANNNDSRWKKLLLVLTKRRYHRLAPTYKEEGREQQSSQKENDANAPTTARIAGDGERQIFYEAVRYLYENNENNDNYHLKAVNSLIRIAPLAGGSRDVCAILIRMIESICYGVVVDESSPHYASSLTEATAECLRLLEEELKVESHTSTSTTKETNPLRLVLDLIRTTLEGDITIVANMKKTGNDDNNNNDDTSRHQLPSTMHMFLPHRDRGRKKSNKRNRANANRNDQVARGADADDEDAIDQPNEGTASTVKSRSYSERELWNAVAEILIFKDTDVVLQSHKAFGPCYRRLVDRATPKDTAARMLHILQTITRNIRKPLNAYAREQGFALTDQYAMDGGSSNLSLSMVRRAKEGDLNILTKRVTKKADHTALKLIQARTEADPAKAVKFASVHELLQSCTDVLTVLREETGTNVAQQGTESQPPSELSILTQKIFTGRVRATVEYLRKLVKKDYTNGTLVVSMESNQVQDVAAILVAAAMSSSSVKAVVDDENKNADKNMEDEKKEPEMSDESESSDENRRVRLFVAGEQRHICNLDEMIQFLFRIAEGSVKNAEFDAPSFMEDGIATTKAVMNILDRHLGKSQTALLLTSADVNLPEDTLNSLTDRGSSVQVHDAEGLQGRLTREGAMKGDVTISLAWDTMDDLDLHVHIPSGKTIYYGNKSSPDGLCNLDVDMNAGGRYSTEPVENVFLGDLQDKKEAPQGKYKIVVQNYSYHDTRFRNNMDREIPFRVTVEMNGKKLSFAGSCKGSGSTSNTTVHEFDYQGRTVPWKTQETNGAFGQSNLVSMTASTGSTLDSLGSLVQASQDLEHMETLRGLVESAENEEMNDGEDEATTERPIVATRRQFEITSRDRMNIQLANLPKCFHDIINSAYGGLTLSEIVSVEISKRMVEDKIPVSALTETGYPDEIIAAVRAAMVTTAA